MVKRKQGTEAVNWVNKIADTLASIPEVAQFVREYPFATGRAWAFDIAWPTFMVAVEYEGNTWVQGASRHTTGGGYHRDVLKYNEAAVMGWCVIRLTADMVRDNSYLAPILKALYLRDPKLVVDDLGDEELIPQEPAGNGHTFEQLWKEQGQA